MSAPVLTAGRLNARRSTMIRMMSILLAGAAALLAGCIQVKAPEKPIEINLNVNIRQEVVVSLRDDVKNLDQKFPGVF
jgi:hypothetical protein